jgi:two-component sensor histidine kinase
MAIVQQTARSATTLEGFEELLMARLQSMATAQDLVTATGGRPVLLADVVGQTMAPFGHARFEIAELEEVNVAGEVAVALGLLLHEMATNAVKYGALSNARGKVRIVREDREAGKVALFWCENGGPQVTAPKRQGFGTRLLQAALRNQGGEVEFRFEPQGFEAQVVFPRAG